MLESIPVPNEFPIFKPLRDIPSYSALDDVFDRSPAELVDLALSRLQAAGIKLIEWRALLYRRMKVPILARHYSYVVADEEMARASDILSNIGLPLSPHSKFLSKIEKEIHTKALHHRLTRSSEPAWVQHFVLYPASFVSLMPHELSPAPSIHLSSPSSTTPSSTTVLVPRPSAVYGWLLRTMAQYPRLGRVRTILASDLSELVCYHFLHVEDGYINPDEDPERWKKFELDRRIADAVALISQWTQDHEWREGEEWFGDALSAIVSNQGDIEHLPCSDS